MHPYNFESISFAKTYFVQIIVRHPKTADSKTIQHKYLDMCGQFWNEQGTVPCAETFGILNVHKLLTTHPKDQYTSQ